jgi:uncharacterized Rossmann fold enzyme
MKKIFLMMAFAGMLTAVSAQTDKSVQTDKTTTKSDAKLKDHVSTKACTPGHHVYAHGEKGHVCTDACKKKM